MPETIVSELNEVQLADEFERVFREHSRLVYRTAYGITLNSEDAQDILQTIFMRLWRRELPPKILKNPRAYLYRAAVNVSLDVLRSRNRRTFVSDTECLKIAASAVQSDDAEMHKLLYNAIAELHPATAHIVILRYLHNYSDAEIAKMLGTARTTIAVRLFRARARLKKLIRASMEKQP